MTTTNYQELYAAALAEVGGISEVLAKNDYNVKIAAVKGGESATSKKFQYGVKLDVVDGPSAGKSTWVNQTLSPENPKAVGVFLKILASLGVPQAAINAGAPPEQLVDYIPKGALGVASLDVHEYGGKPRQDLKFFRLTSTPAGVGVLPAAPTSVSTPTPVAVAVPVPVQPVAVPVVVPPVVAQPVALPVPTPAAPVAQVQPVAAPAAGTTVAELQAQLAALQAQAVAPVAGAPVQPTF